MTAIFDDIYITWAGNKYTIKGDDKILMLLASIEEIMTAKELFEYMQRKDIPLVKLSMAYTKVLNFVGAKNDNGEDITAPQVYADVFSKLTEQDQIISVTMTLVQMMIPKSEKVVEKKSKPKGTTKRKPKTQGVK